MRGVSKEDAAAPDPPRVNSALIRVYIKGQGLLALLDTGCGVDSVSEETARRCNLPVHSLAQSLRLRFADGRQNARIGKVTEVKCQFQSEIDTIDTVWDFYVGPVHHDVIVSPEAAPQAEGYVTCQLLPYAGVVTCDRRPQ